MKAKNFSGLWRAIVFLSAAVTALFSCSSCEPEELPVVYETSITLAVESVTEQSATLVAEAKAGNQNLTVVFECFLAEAWQTFEGGAISGTKTKTIKKEINGLNPGTSYRVRAYLKEGQGKKLATSAEVQLSTNKELEKSITLSVKGVTEQSATLVAEAEAGGKELEIVFEYLKDETWELIASEPVSGVEKKTVEKEFSNLYPDRAYRVRAYLQDAKKEKIAASSEVEFSTSKTAAAIDISFKGIYRNRVIMEVVAKGRNSQESLGLWLEYFDGRSWQSVFVKDISGVAVQTAEQEISGLTADTRYRVRAYLLSPTEIRLTNSNELDFATLRAAMLELVSKDVGLTSIDLGLGITPYDDTKVIISYQAKGQAAKVITSEVYTGSQIIPLEFKLENLERSTVYNISIKTDEVNSTPIELSLETYAVSDYDGNLYRTVTIGDQTFLRENLKTTHFLNGDPIPNVTSDTQWVTLKTPAYCYYNNDPKMGEKYGALYNWYVASDPRGLIEGFHVPTLEEWKKFSAYLVKNELEVKSDTPDWKQPNLLWGKPSGFEVLPAGIRGGNNGEGVNNGKFQAFGEAALFWASSIEPALPQAADSPACYYGTPSISVGGLNSRWKGQSIRLVKN